MKADVAESRLKAAFCFSHIKTLVFSGVLLFNHIRLYFAFPRIIKKNFNFYLVELKISLI